MADKYLFRIREENERKREASKEKEMYVPGTKIEKPVVRLVGEDGNAYAIMGRVSSALKKKGVPKEIIDEYACKSQSGDYNNLLRVAMEYTHSSFGDEEDEMDWDELDAEEIG